MYVRAGITRSITPRLLLLWFSCRPSIITRTNSIHTQDLRLCSWQFAPPLKAIVQTSAGIPTPWCRVTNKRGKILITSHLENNSFVVATIRASNVSKSVVMWDPKWWIEPTFNVYLHMHFMCVFMYVLYAQRAYLIHIRRNDFQPSSIWFITFIKFSYAYICNITACSYLRWIFHYFVYKNARVRHISLDVVTVCLFTVIFQRFCRLILPWIEQVIAGLAKAHHLAMDTELKKRWW